MTRPTFTEARNAVACPNMDRPVRFLNGGCVRFL